MKRFAFRLERVLKVRETVLSTRQVALAGAQFRLGQEEETLAAVTGTLRRSESQFRKAASGAAAPWRLALASRYVRFLEFEEDKQQVEVEKARDQVEICRQRLIEARQETRILEKLKDKRFGSYVSEVLKEDQSTLDEIGVTSYVTRGQV
ncbi:MAG: flagellar export protein FliJ [Firmicutes bacterium]|nr:flagellar export protein FliJ [Bacillota bacterium]